MLYNKRPDRDIWETNQTGTNRRPDRESETELGRIEDQTGMDWRPDRGKSETRPERIKTQTGTGRKVV